VLLVGTGRTGTEFLAHFFSNVFAQRVLAIHEPGPDFLELSIKEKEMSLSPKRVINQIRINRISYILRAYFSKRIYLESNNNLSFLLPYLTKAFPNLKIVFIIRDLDTFLLSELNKRHGKSKFLIYSEEDFRRRITPEIIKSDCGGDWKKFSRAKKIIWYWWACNDYVISYLSSNCYSYLHLNFEDLFTKKSKVHFNRLFEYVGLNNVNESIIDAMLAKKLNSSKNKEFDNLNKLSPDDSKYYEEKKALILQKITNLN
jgi:hypothetical protein